MYSAAASASWAAMASAICQCSFKTWLRRTSEPVLEREPHGHRAADDIADLVEKAREQLVVGRFGNLHVEPEILIVPGLPAVEGVLERARGVGDLPELASGASRGGKTRGFALQLTAPRKIADSWRRRPARRTR